MSQAASTQPVEIPEVVIDDLFMDSSNEDDFSLQKPKIIQKTIEKELNAIMPELYAQVYKLASKVETDQNMVTFSIKISETHNVKLDVIKVGSVIYVRVILKGVVTRGYIMLSSQSNDAIYELKAECKFPEQPVVEEIPVEICTLLVRQIDDATYKLDNISSNLVESVLHCLWDIIKTDVTTIQAQCATNAIQENWVKMTGQ